MKKIFSAPPFAVLIILVLIAACGKTGNAPSVDTILGVKWTYTYYSTCPVTPDPPCYLYKIQDTAAFGGGIVFLQIGPNNKIYRTFNRGLAHYPFSYFYPANSDSLSYQKLNNSTLTVSNNNQVLGTVKITSLTATSMSLTCTSPFGTVLEVDSLRK